MHRLTIFKVSMLSVCLTFISYTWGNHTTKVDHAWPDNKHENWHGDTTSPLVNYEPTIVSTSDFYLKEILKQLSAINKKIDRAMIRLIGSTVKGEDNDENVGKYRYSNFTMPNCESLIGSNSTSGIYNFPNKNSSHGWIWNVFEIYCDQTLGGGWTVIQRRGKISSSSGVNFTEKCWDDYAIGFGDLNGEFWLGNEWIHRMTTLFGPYELRIEFEDPPGHKLWAQYSEFTISSYKDNYRLKIDGYSLGNYTNTTDSKENSTILNNLNFTNDLVYLDHACAMDFHGTWWHPDNCIGVNLNGDRYNNTKMMIRLKNHHSSNTTQDSKNTDKK